MALEARIPNGYNGIPGDESDFPGSNESINLSATDFRKFGPVSKREYESGYYRNFNGLMDGAVYSSVAQIAESRHPTDELKQKALIASYFKWRGISWETVA